MPSSRAWHVRCCAGPMNQSQTGREAKPQNEDTNKRGRDAAIETISTPEERGHVVAVLREFSNVMLSTFTPGPNAWAPQVQTRPMAVARLDDDGTMVFITSRDGVKVHTVAARRRGQVTVQSPLRYATLTGRLDVRDDRKLIRDVWSKANEAWLDGPEDPKAVALVFTPELAEIWDSSGRRGLRFLLASAKALFTGDKEVEADADQHVKVQMHDGR
jgi:general stress protein 26